MGSQRCEGVSGEFDTRVEWSKLATEANCRGALVTGSSRRGTRTSALEGKTCPQDACRSDAPLRLSGC